MRTITCDQCGKVIATSGVLRISLEALRPNGAMLNYDFDTVACMKTKIDAVVGP